MTSAISSISSVSVASSSSASSSSALTEDTKKKLEALGIDTSNIKTETEGQQKLKEAQAAQASAQQKPQSNTSMEIVEDNAKSLASKIGAVVGNDDKIDDIFDKISTKISDLKASAGNDETKKSAAEAFDSEYNTLYSEYNRVLSSMKMTGATALGNYNKVALGI